MTLFLPTAIINENKLINWATIQSNTTITKNGATWFVLWRYHFFKCKFHQRFILYKYIASFSSSKWGFSRKKIFSVSFQIDIFAGQCDRIIIRKYFRKHWIQRKRQYRFWRDCIGTHWRQRYSWLIEKTFLNHGKNISFIRKSFKSFRQKNSSLE